MESIRTRVRGFVLAATGAVVALLVLRFILVFTGVQQGHFLVKLLLDVSGVFVYPFQSFGNTSLPNFIDTNALLAILMYVILGILVSELVTAFLQESAGAIAREGIDAVFKFLEFLLICRIVFKLFGLNSATGPFVNNVFVITDWSSGILPPREFLFGVLDLSAIIVLIIVVVIDLATEGILASLMDRVGKWRSARALKPKPEAKPVAEVKTETKVVEKIIEKPVVVNPAPAPAQSITINVPVPPPAPVAPPAPQGPAASQVAPAIQAQTNPPAPTPTPPSYGRVADTEG